MYIKLLNIATIGVPYIVLALAKNDLPCDKILLYDCHRVPLCTEQAQSPLLSCRRNISLPVNSYSFKGRILHISALLHYVVYEIGLSFWN